MSLFLPRYFGDSLELGMVHHSTIGGTEVERLRATTDAIGFRFIAPVTANITAFHVFQRNSPGLGNTVTMTGEIRDAHATDTKIPDVGVLDSATTSSRAADGWLSFTGLTVSITRGQFYWLVVYSADAGIATPANEVQIQRFTSGEGHSVQDNGRTSRLACSGSTDSFTTGTIRINSGNDGHSVGLALIYTDDSDYPVFGTPYVDNGGPGGSANDEFGWLIPSFTEDVALDYVKWRTPAVSPDMTHLRIYSGNNGPGASYVLNHALSALENATATVILPSVVVLTAGVAHRITLRSTGGARDTYKTYLNNDNTPANANLCGIGGGFILTRGSGGAWTEISTEVYKFKIGVRDFVVDAGVPALELTIEENGDVKIEDATAADTDICVHEEFAVEEVPG